MSGPNVSERPPIPVMPSAPAPRDRTSSAGGQPRALIAFFLLAYAISWAWVIPWAVTGHTVAQGRGWPTHLPSLLGPMLAAFIVTAWASGAAGMRDLLARMGRWRIGVRWWLAALAPLVFFAAVLAVMATVGDGAPPLGKFARFSGIPDGLGIIGMARW